MGISNSRAEDNRRQVVAAINSGGALGTVFYVNSSITGARDAAGRGQTPLTPLNTIDFAVGRCTDSKDDVIIVGSGHTESVTADSGIDFDVIGITVVGMGRGAQRPTVTFSSSTAADVKLAAMGVRVENILFVNAIDAIVAPITISGAYCELVNCEFQDGTAGVVDLIRCIDILVTGDSCLIDGFVLIGNTDNAPESAIRCAAGATDLRIMNCYISGQYGVGNFEQGNTTDLVRIGPNNLLINTDGTDTCIDVVSTGTGSIFGNLLEIATNGQITSVTIDNDMSLYENYFVNLDGEAGGIVGVVSTEG